MIEKESAVEMIHFVAEGAGKQIGTFDTDFLTVDVHTGQHDLLRAKHGRGETGDAQTAFFFELFTLCGDDPGVKEGKQAIFLFAAGGVRDHDSFRNTDLRGSQTYAGSLVHCLDHILDELYLRVGYVCYWLRLLLEHFASAGRYQFSQPADVLVRPAA